VTFKTMIPILLALAASPAFGEDLQPYVGEWRGKGWVQNTADTKEVLRCRLAANLKTDQQIDFDGTCATPAASGSFFLALAFGEDGRQIAARLRSTAAAEALDLKGLWDGTSATMAGTSEAGIAFQLNLEFDGSDHFDLAISSGEGAERLLRLRAAFQR